MMSRTQITIEDELQRQARQRANEIGVSLAEYVRRLVARDLVRTEPKVDLACIFDIGASGNSDIATEKDTMIAEAFASKRRKPQRN
jgi:hypothetical protein